jgi:hypothetical protein
MMEMVACEKHTIGECKLLNQCSHAEPHIVSRITNTLCTNTDYFPFINYYNHCPFTGKEHVCSNKTKLEIIMERIIKENKNGY